MERTVNGWIGVLTLIATVSVAVMACQGKPIPLAAARGSTVLIPIGSGGFNFGEGVLMGYGTPGDPDYQRGRLRLWLDTEPDPDIELTMRGIARVSPDPASRAGLSLGADWEQPGQVVVAVDVPLSAPVGSWYVYARRYTFQWDAGSSTWIEQELPAAQAPNYQFWLDILPETASPTPFEGFALGSVHDLNDEVLDFKPLPKLRFGLSNVTVGAVRFTVTYPSARAAIRGVTAEPIDDTNAWAAQGLLTHSESSPGVLEVSAIVPNGVTAPAFGLVFELTNPTSPPPTGGALVPANFVISGLEAWDVSGAPVTASVAAGSKKIF